MDAVWVTAVAASDGTRSVTVLPDVSVGAAVAGGGLQREVPLAAFTVPADGDLSGIKKLLECGREEGWWHVEVGCGNGTWWNARPSVLER